MFWRFVLSLFGLSLLLGCGKGEKDKTLTIGVTAGPHVEIMEFVKVRAHEAGLEVKIIEFNDFILPNSALNNGAIDANSYQHLPFLEEQIKSRGYSLSSIGKTVLLSMGIYSKKVENLNALKEGAKVAIPNDPTNGGRALLLLQEEGLLVLKPGVGFMATVLDIEANPKMLKIIEIESPQIPRTLSDVDIAVINTDWALLGRVDADMRLALESKESPYANIFVVRTEDKGRKDILKLLKIYQTRETADFMKERYGDAVIPAWDL